MVLKAPNLSFESLGVWLSKDVQSIMKRQNMKNKNKKCHSRYIMSSKDFSSIWHPLHTESNLMHKEDLEADFWCGMQRVTRSGVSPPRHGDRWIVDMNDTEPKERKSQWAPSKRQPSEAHEQKTGAL